MVAPPWWAIFFPGPFAMFFVPGYWVVLTDRRLIFVRLLSDGKAMIEQGSSRSSISVERDFESRFSRAFTVVGDGWNRKLRFMGTYKQAGQAIALALAPT